MIVSPGSLCRNYKILSRLRPGSQGSVCVVEEVNSKMKFVMKSVFSDKNPNNELEEMISNWKSLCHSQGKNHFVEYKEHFYEESDFLVIMEYCEKGDLESVIKKKFNEKKKFSEEEVMKLLIDGMKALKELHDKKWIHRDIKSANILIGKDGNYKLCDFGISRSLSLLNVGKTLVGTPEFSAPEIVNAEDYSYPIDIFSLGVVLYQMIVGKTPFANERGVLLKNLMVGQYEPIHMNLGYSATLIDLVHSCLSLDPTTRPTAAQVLEMPFVMQAHLTLLASDAAAAVHTDTHARVAILEERVRIAEEKNAAAEKRIAALEKEAEETTRLLKVVMGEMETLKKGKALPENFPLRFVSNPVATAVSTTGNGSRLVWNSTDAKTFFVEPVIVSAGIYKIEIECEGSFGGNFQFGIAQKAQVDRIAAANFSGPGVCYLWKEGINLGEAKSAYYTSFLDTSGKATLALELDADAHTLHFFVKGVQIPHAVTGIPEGVQFGVYRRAAGSVVELKLLARLATPSVSSTMVCAQYKWVE